MTDIIFDVVCCGSLSLNSFKSSQKSPIHQLCTVSRSSCQSIPKDSIHKIINSKNKIVIQKETMRTATISNNYCLYKIQWTIHITIADIHVDQLDNSNNF